MGKKVSLSTLGGCVKFSTQVIRVTAVQEKLLLQEPDKHQSVQQHGGVPAAFVLVHDTFNQREKFIVDFLELPEEHFGHRLHVEGGAHPFRSDGDRYVALIIQFSQIDDQSRELGEEQVAGLPFDVGVAAGQGALTVALHPVPERLGAGRVHEDGDVLDRLGAEALPNHLLIFRVRKRGGRIERTDLVHPQTAQFRNLPHLPLRAILVRQRQQRAARRVVPVEHLNEEVIKPECLQGRAGILGIKTKLGHIKGEFTTAKKN